ncbi:MAG: hypothetical protein QOG66_2373 [Methylobacteriaceae bacterium]|jgi:hypothetical protein|nr:hypothetical protein [Methylobacteriaceae bacterium]
MPRYFFDVVEDGTTFLDEEGLEFSDPAAAHADVLRTLGELAREKLHSDRQSLMIRVRDGGEEPLWTASLTLRIES